MSGAGGNSIRVQRVRFDGWGSGSLLRGITCQGLAVTVSGFSVTGFGNVAVLKIEIPAQEWDESVHTVRARRHGLCNFSNYI